MKDNLNQYIVCFGEVLWDLLPSAAVPGGAPMNVAYHLHTQNVKAALITRVGRDEEGRKLVDIFFKNGIDTQYFQVDEKYGTGKVYAREDQKKDMTYEIVMPVAWDFIEWDDRLEELVRNAACFVYGSLAARSAGSAGTLFRLLEIAPQKVLDINLRAPHFEKAMLGQLLHKADLLKMNLEELEYVCGWFANYETTEDRVKFISEKYDIPEIVITKGKDGAVLYTAGNFFYHGGFSVHVADTVGSGDAFLAGMLANRLKKISSAETLEWASQMGAYIASRTGACPPYDLEDVKAIKR
jgi:fructokinase